METVDGILIIKKERKRKRKKTQIEIILSQTLVSFRKLQERCVQCTGSKTIVKEIKLLPLQKKPVPQTFVKNYNLIGLTGSVKQWHWMNLEKLFSIKTLKISLGVIKEKIKNKRIRLHGFESACHGFGF